jgi:hypothetical protein
MRAIHAQGREAAAGAASPGPHAAHATAVQAQPVAPADPPPTGIFPVMPPPRERKHRTPKADAGSGGAGGDGQPPDGTSTADAGPQPPTETEVEPLTDAVALLVMATGDAELAVHQAAHQLSKRRGISGRDAVAIVRRARQWLRSSGEKRKALDPATQAALHGEARARFMVLARMAMDPANFTKGGGAVALKCFEKIALLDGCPVDGMVQVTGTISHEHSHEHRVVDPERAAIAASILERVKRQRIIEVEAEA